MLDGSLIGGLDVGNTKVCCVLAKYEGTGSPAIIGVGTSRSDGIRRGVVTDISSAAQAIRTAVDAASRQAGEPISSVYISLSGDHVQSAITRGVAAVLHPNQEITPEDRDRAIEQSRGIIVPPERMIIHSIPRMYSIDGQDGIRQPVGMCGSRLEVETFIAMVTRSSLLNMERCITQAGLDLDGKTLASLASGAAVLTPDERQQGVVVIDIGSGTTDVAVFTEGEICHAYVKAVGSEHVTNDIAQVLRVTVDEAERLKIEHGHAVASEIGDTEAVDVLQIGRTVPRPLRRRALCEIIEARIQELFMFVANELQRANLLARCTAGVVLTGGGSQLSGIDHCACRVLGLPARIAGPVGIGRLAPTGLQTTALADRDSPEYATAVGIVRWAAASLLQDDDQDATDPWSRIVSWVQRLVGRR